MFKTFGDFFGKKNIIDDKILLDNKIPIIKKKDIAMAKAEICATNNGKFYKGTYFKEQVTIKVFLHK